MDLEAIERRLSEIYGHGDWILVTEAAAGLGDAIDTLRSWGAGRCLVIAGAPGVGHLPEDVEIHYTGSGGTSIMDGLREFDRSLLSDETEEAVDRFDPDMSARVLAPTFGAEEAFERRRVYGRRRAAWRALEDKTTIDAVFEGAGVDVAAHAVVPVSLAPDASDRLAGPDGCVWVADNRRGWHGGGEYTRWIPDATAAEAAVSWFSDRADLVRVMPFLEGLPCSIHGWVGGDGAVGVFRPVEMLVARVSHPPSFRYLGTATTWDPPDRMRREMRGVARAVGRHLAESVGYLGPFSIDGVATASGFRPTELNPRLSAGLGIQGRSVEGLRLGWMTRALYEGDLAIDADGLGRLVTRAADDTRTIRNGMPFYQARDPDRIDVVVDGGRIRPADGAPHGSLTIGEASSGSFVLLSLDQEHVPVGPSFAGTAVSAARLAADTWDLELPPLEPATDVTGDAPQA